MKKYALFVIQTLERDLIDDKEKNVVSYIDEAIVLQKISHLGVSKRLFKP